MNTAIVNVKVNPKVKKEAQKVAEDLGLSLSSLINGYLRHLIRTKTVNFSLSEEPSEYMIQALKESKADIKAKRVISFKKPSDALDYLDKLIADEKKSKQN
ncbi:type II toxin-antitoxin system RelB/DinJ family antitoxin [Patescibacteria group bacterium]|nr:type II toxin-antitoxin system RelB/DinJ family antitoxin [Patescibacteria group bacterium]